MLKKTLKKLRIDWDLTQEEMAEHLGISQSTYCNIENGKRKPSCDVLMKLHTKFHVDNALDLFKEGDEDV